MCGNVARERIVRDNAMCVKVLRVCVCGRVVGVTKLGVTRMPFK